MEATATTSTPKITAGSYRSTSLILRLMLERGIRWCYEVYDQRVASERTTATLQSVLGKISSGVVQLRPAHGDMDDFMPGFEPFVDNRTYLRFTPYCRADTFAMIDTQRTSRKRGPCGTCWAMPCPAYRRKPSSIPQPK